MEKYKVLQCTNHNVCKYVEINEIVHFLKVLNVIRGGVIWLGKLLNFQTGKCMLKHATNPVKCTVKSN